MYRSASKIMFQTNKDTVYTTSQSYSRLHGNLRSKHIRSLEQAHFTLNEHFFFLIISIK